MSKKLTSLALASALTLASFGHADERENRPTLHVNQYNNKKPAERGMINRDVTPSAAPLMTPDINGFITADFIYWTATQNGLSFAKDGFPIAPATSATPGKLYDMGNSWDPGFKVGAGITFNHDGWDVYAQYTWLNNSTDSKASSSDGNLYSTWEILNVGATPVQATPLNNLTRAEANWKLRFNVIDLELGRNFFLSRHLKLRPHFGLKGAWQEQRYNVEYATASNATVTRLYQDQNHWGLGIRGGFKSSWQFTREVSIYGNFALSALGGCFDNARKTTQTTDSTITTGDFKADDYSTVNTVLEWGLGLRWETWFCNDQYHFGIDAGWEQQNWFDMNQMPTVTDPSRRSGSLSLQGFTLKARFDF